MCGILKRIKNIFFKEATPPDPAFSKRILTIDDDITQLTMIQRTLAKSGYSVLIAENGPKGLEVALKEKPDLILLDVMMPGMHGVDVCRELKANPQTKDIPVIFLTSMDMPQDVIEQYIVGADIHLTKPINAKELISQVEISLGLK